MKQVQSIIKTGRRFTVDVDLSKCFDRVNHDLLLTHLGYKVKDKRLLKLIKRYLRAGVLCKIKGDNQFYSESREGVPQGGPLSPLLANYCGIASGYQRCVDLDQAQSSNGLLATVAKATY